MFTFKMANKYLSKHFYVIPNAFEILSFSKDTFGGKQLIEKGNLDSFPKVVKY